MSVLAWDQVGERRFETGVDRAVLYVLSGDDVIGVPWNGFVGVDETPDASVTPRYLDGVKYLDTKDAGNFQGTLKAFTYPPEFEPFNGFGVTSPGVLVGNQPSPYLFHLAYRTRIGNDVDGVDYGYKIHILWNISAVPNSLEYTTLSADIEPMELSWAITTVPSELTGFRPSAYLVLDSTEIDSEALAILEDILYGTDLTDPTLPTLSEMVLIAATTIIDGGDELAPYGTIIDGGGETPVGTPDIIDGGVAV